MSITLQRISNMRRLALSGVLLLVFLSTGSSGDRKEFSNPILAGFYPDPSICRVGDDYYLVNSSFSYFPGIPVFQSKDLVHWSLIGHVMDRPEQLNLDSLGVSREIFAPAIRYKDGVFYVTCTFVDGGGNFVVTSRTPRGPWSDPVWLPQVDGIDPSLFFDDDSRAYLIYNSAAPDKKPLYDGHRTIRMYEFDTQHLKVIGSERILVNGGTDIRKKPVWIEGPHIFHKNGFYYLIAAEGGTGDQHSEVVFRSRNIDGPYVSYEKNPILTQRNLDPRREHPVTSTGHADLVETVKGDWWAVFLGCRPYAPCEQGFYNTGRETFLAPVRWQNDWPVIDPEHENVQYSYELPVQPSGQATEPAYSGNFVFRDEFAESTLRGDWVFLRTPREKWYSLTDRPGSIAMRLRPETCSQPANPSFIGRRQSHARGAASVSLDFQPKTDREKAGLLVFQNERHFYYLCKTLQDSVSVVQLYKSAAGDDADHGMELMTSRKLEDDPGRSRDFLKIEARGDTYAFFYASRPDSWHLLREDVPAAFLSTKVAGGFVGCMYALYATSLGAQGANTAFFDWFEYAGDDEVYR
jgi:xylan 1,4-beta-xylosidase